MRLKLAELEALVQRVLWQEGHTEAEAQCIGAVLLYAQLRDNNQGIVKLIGPGLRKDPRAGAIQIMRETPVSALVDGQHNMGMLVLQKATEIAIEKARQSGLAVVGTHRTATSTGAIGYYARQIAEQGMIGLVFAGSIPTVTTAGSFEPLFGTNPIAIGVPTDAEPVVLDMATAALAYYGLIEANTAGRPIPPDVAYDQQGRPTTDPAAALDGALRPFDRGHKSAGLALMVEILTGPLVAASFIGLRDGADNWGNLVLVVDPGLLVDKESFRQEVGQLLARVKQARRLPDVPEIFLPGERGDRLMRERLASGEIEVEDNLYQAIAKRDGHVR
jgi:LDH2 family malate/lactate/ureidoglycolate dehydrogenase